MDARAVAPWTEERLRVVLLAAIVTTLLLGAGLVFTVLRIASSAQGTEMVQSAQKSHPVGADGVRGEQYRDEVAAAPMLATTEDDMSPSAPALRQLPTISLPMPDGPQLAGVPTVTAHTPEGAVAQLAALTVSTLAEMSLVRASDIYDAWSVNADGFERWPLALAIQSFHHSAGTRDGDPQIGVRAEPVGAQIKATDGSDWALACIQLDISIVYNDETRFGFGHCERMIWTANRWTIDAGAPPAPAPSTWPSSQRSVDAGWHPVLTEGDH